MVVDSKAKPMMKPNQEADKIKSCFLFNSPGRNRIAASLFTCLLLAPMKIMVDEVNILNQLTLAKPLQKLTIT